MKTEAQLKRNRDAQKKWRADGRYRKLTDKICSQCLIKKCRYGRSLCRGCDHHKLVSTSFRAMLADKIVRIRSYDHKNKFENDLDVQYLLDLLSEQRGLCALTNLQMNHKCGDLCSISIDRIDSSRGHVKGNVQLVCKWINLGKSDHSNDEMKAVIELFKAAR